MEGPSHSTNPTDVSQLHCSSPYGYVEDGCFAVTKEEERFEPAFKEAITRLYVMDFLTLFRPAAGVATSFESCVNGVFGGLRTHAPLLRRPFGGFGEYDLLFVFYCYPNRITSVG